MSTGRNTRRLLTLGIMILAVPAMVLAFSPVTPKGEQQGVAIIHASELAVNPSLTRFEQGTSEAWMKPGVTTFFKEHSAGWDVSWDDRSDLPNLISGVGIPMIPGHGNTLEGVAPESLQEIEQAVRGFIADNEAFFSVEGSDFVLRPAGSGNFGANHQLWFVELQQMYKGIPVDGAVLFFRINNGNLIQFGSERVAPISLKTRTNLSAEAALELTLETMGLTQEQTIEVINRGDLKIYPTLPAGESAGDHYEGTPGQGYGHVLVREIVFKISGDEATYRSIVDVQKGQVIDLTDINDYIDVKGGIYPESYLDTEVVKTFQQVATSGSTTYLDGVYTRINDNCGSISCSDSADGSTDNVINLGTSGGDDCTTPGYGGAGNTHSARTGHYHLTNINRIAASYYPSNSWLNSKLTANMNINNTCNAYWNGSTVNFYRSGGGCGNTGEIAAVFLHEWGHGMDTNSGGGSDSGSGETVGDTFAMLYLRSSCIGQGFFSDGSDCYNCSNCSGVRDPADFSYNDGVSTIATPATVTSNSGINCDRWSCPYYGYMGPMGYEGHCESYISSSAVWDLGVELRAAHGTEAGWNTIEQIWYDSLVPSKQAYQVVSGGQCNTSATINGCGATNYYEVFLAADDDDGNLSNGTPNGCRIWDAFNYHGIACGSRPACSTGCTPTAIADAGPDKDICPGDTVQIGTAALAGHSYSWSPGGYTVAQPTVSPTSTTTYTVTATTTCGSDADSMTVNVLPSGGGGGLNDTFEGDTSGWSTSGLWHKTTNSSCASPGYSTATHAFYYGQDSNCTYSTGSATTGNLISPAITGITSSSTLTFDYYRQVESYSGAYDKAEVAVEVDGSGSWTTVWSRTSANTSQSTWLSSGAISLASYAGSNIRVRFTFNSVDSLYNGYTGWFVDDVVVTGSALCP